MEKSSTPLISWFYAMFLMTHTRSKISIKDLERELGVTYKTAWRIFKSIKYLMSLNNADLLKDYDSLNIINQSVHKWTIFRKLEITLTNKSEDTD